MYKKLLLSFFLMILVAVSSTNVVDNISTKQLDRAFERSITVFAIARGLNGLISVVQGTEVYATPAGVGVNFAVGQILDPLNDMVERFSLVMLLSSVSLGVQEVILQLGKTELIQYLLALGAAVLIAMLWVKDIWHKQSFNLLFKAFIILSFLRFVVPIIVLFNALIFTYALEPKYEQAKTALEITELESQSIIKNLDINRQRQVKVQNYQNKTVWEKANLYFEKTLKSFDLKQRLRDLQYKFQHLLKELKDKFNNAITYMLSLITIFIIESILMPLFALWVFMRLFREFLRADMGEMFEQKLKHD